MSHTIRRTHIDHATGEIALEIDSPNPAAPAFPVRWRTRASATVKPDAPTFLADLQADVEEQAASVADVPAERWTSALHRAREAQALTRDAEAKREREEQAAQHARKVADDATAKAAQVQAASAAQVARAEAQRADIEALTRTAEAKRVAEEAAATAARDRMAALEAEVTELEARKAAANGDATSRG
jgi:hypothetical protein